MKLLTSSEIKEYELNILLDVKRFCENNNIRFYLASGTLIGAVRHHGFIPWDDDIDIYMPRPDYEKFLMSYYSPKGFKVISNLLHNWDHPYAKVINTLTRVESVEAENEPGLWIDIFPVDGLPEDLKVVEKIYKKGKLYRHFLWCGYSKFGTGGSTIRKLAKYIIKPLVSIYGINKLCEKLENMAHTYPYESSEYVGAITWGYVAGERMKKSEFEKVVNVSFEGYEFPTFSCWDSYLHNVYGDYMILPPENERQTHRMKVYVKD